MIIDERMSAFIDSLDSGNPALLNEIEKYALDTQVPIIRRSMQSLLKFLLTYTKPKSILEVGTAIGFSALLMSEYAPADCHITTIEKYEKRIPIARENFDKYGREDKITLLEGDATEILKELDGTYDVIFMDAAKGQYINFLPDILRLLSPGGLLISDNRIPICGHQAQPYDSCENAGIFIRIKTSSRTGDSDPARGGWRDVEY